MRKQKLRKLPFTIAMKRIKYLEINAKETKGIQIGKEEAKLTVCR